MSGYLVRRLLYMLLLLWLVSVVAFTIIQLPQGDFVTSLAVRLGEQGETVTQELLDGLRRRYGLDQPAHVQYLKWFGNVLRGDFGFRSVPTGPSAKSHRADIGLLAGVLLRRRDPRRHLLRHAPVPVRRLPVHGRRLHRPGHAELPARAGADVRRS